MQVASSTGNPGSISTLSRTGIGCLKRSTNEQFFPGLLDDVRIYNRALTTEEISNLASGLHTNEAEESVTTATFTLSSNLDVTNNITLNAGTLGASDHTITVGGNWTKSASGTFTAGTSTITLDGANQTLSGSTTFYNLAKTVSAADTLTFAAGQTFIAENSLTLRGTADNILSLRSSAEGTAYTLRLSEGGTQTIDYLSVRDSDASGGETLACYTASEGCVNVANNMNWAFIAATDPPTITSPASGSFTNDTTPAISGTGSTTTNTIRVYSGSTLLCSTTVQGDESWSCNSSVLSEDTYTLHATEDNGAVSGNAATITLTIDTTASSAPGTPDLLTASDIGSSSTDNITSDTTPTFSISCQSTDTVMLLSGSTVLGSGTCASSTVSITSTSLTDGAYSITARQQDSAGNVSATGSALSVTIDTTAPVVSTLSPADDATNVATTANLVITFDEAVTKVGTGRITIYTSSDDSLVETIAVTGSLVTGSGTTHITIDPSVTLANSTGYYVQISSIAFYDAVGNNFAGISDSTTWNFTTVAATAVPSSSSSSPGNEGGGGGGGGRRGSEETMAKLIAQAHATLLARFHKDRQDGKLQIVQEEEKIEDVQDSPVSRPTPIASIAERRNRIFVWVEETPVLYADVPLDAWYAPYVATVIESGIAQGYKTPAGELTGEFGVQNSVTRAEVLKMALEAAGISPDPTAKIAPQNRSARGTWAAAYVKQAEDMGLGIFRTNPDVHTPATRGEVIQTILDAMDFVIGNTTSTFDDVPSDHPYSRAIALAAFNGFIEGDTDSDGRHLNRFRPDDSMNRAEVAKIIALVVEVHR